MYEPVVAVACAFEGLAIMHSWLINTWEVPMFLFCVNPVFSCTGVKVEPEVMACFT